jgi:hypothetical protein
MKIKVYSVARTKCKLFPVSTVYFSIRICFGARTKMSMVFKKMKLNSWMIVWDKLGDKIYLLEVDGIYK